MEKYKIIKPILNIAFDETVTPNGLRAYFTEEAIQHLKLTGYIEKIPTTVNTEVVITEKDLLPIFEGNVYLCEKYFAIDNLSCFKETYYTEEYIEESLTSINKINPFLEKGYLVKVND